MRSFKVVLLNLTNKLKRKKNTKKIKKEKIFGINEDKRQTGVRGCDEIFVNGVN